MTLTIPRKRLYLLLLRLWAYGPPRRTARLQHASEAQQCTFKQAEQLLAAGYCNAAIFVSRFAVEKALFRLSKLSVSWKKVRAGSINDYAHILCKAGLIEADFKNRLRIFSRKASHYVHNSNATRRVAEEIHSEATELRRMIVEASTVVFSK